MRNTKLALYWNRLKLGRLTFAIAACILGVILPAISLAQQRSQVTFDLVANPKFKACLRQSGTKEPTAHVTVTRGTLNDTMTLDLDGIKAGLNFDLFTIQRTSLLNEVTPNPNFSGSFGLAWYQSDIHIGADSTGHVHLETILLDQIFGFDPDKSLTPTQTLHVGFWFNNPQDAAECGFPAGDPTKFTPFNGEHNAGPLAMISVPNPNTKLGPLCTESDPANPGKCKP